MVIIILLLQGGFIAPIVGFAMELSAEMTFPVGKLRLPSHEHYCWAYCDW